MAKTKKLAPPPLWDESLSLAKGKHMGINYQVTVGSAYTKCGYLFIPDGHPWSRLRKGNVGSPYIPPKVKWIRSIYDRLPFYISCTRKLKGYRMIGFSSALDVIGHDDLPDVALVRREAREHAVLDEDGEFVRWKDKDYSKKHAAGLHLCLMQYEYPLSCDWKPGSLNEIPSIISIDRMVTLLKAACVVAHSDALKR